MSNLLNKTIEGISLSSFNKNGSSYIATGQIVSLENPFTKEYKVLIDGIQVIAYGIYDQVFSPGSTVTILRSTLDGQSDHFILRGASGAGPTETLLFDEYDQIGKPIELSTSNNSLLQKYLAQAENPYYRIVTDITISGAPTSGDFISSLKIGFTNGKTEDTSVTQIYSTSHMEGVISGVMMAQKSGYFKLPEGKNYIVSIGYEDIGCTSAWVNTFIIVYNKSSQGTACRLTAPEGFETDDTVDKKLTLKVKMRDDFKPVAPTEIKWFRENPLVYGPGDSGYDEEAGIGWERFYPNVPVGE